MSKSRTLTVIHKLLHELYDKDCEEARKVRAAERAIAAVEQRQAELERLLKWLSSYEEPWIVILNASGERVF
jgi:hypothetical protein